MNFLPEDHEGPAAVDRLSSEGMAVIGAPGNVAERAEAEAMVRDATRRLGGLSILVNNAGTAGGTHPIPFPDLDVLTDDFWDLILSTNLLGAFWCARAAAPALTEARGCIVNTASIAGLGRRGSSIPYAASKSGLISVTRSLAVALAPAVRVNAVAPGFVQTAWTRNWPAEKLEQAIASSLLRRAATPEDIASVMVFLASPGSYINAQTIVVDGGQV